MKKDTDSLLDTTNFSDLDARAYKQQTQKKWSDNPCGSNYSDQEQDSIAYFDEIEQHRYRSHPWIKETIQSLNLTGKNVLEIGVGMGTDHINLAKSGAKMHGIDLTQRHLDITRKRLTLSNKTTTLINGDAEKLPFSDNSLDFIYSFGVIHHTPNTEKVIDEIYRVLKPDGSCYITVYHRNSIFFWWSVFLFNFILRRGFLKRTLKQQISLVEWPGTNENLVIRLYRKQAFSALFSKFTTKKCCVEHLIPVDIEILTNLFKTPDQPTPLLQKLGKHFGWYLIMSAKK